MQPLGDVSEFEVDSSVESVGGTIGTFILRSRPPSSAIGPSATSRGDPVMSASRGEAVVRQTSAEVRV